MFLEQPRLYCNTPEECKHIISLLTEEGIPYINLGPTSEEVTPFLQYGEWKFSQIQGILEFISKWHNKKLPPIDVL
jgi:hypothetical protein